MYMMLNKYSAWAMIVIAAALAGCSIAPIGAVVSTPTAAVNTATATNKPEQNTSLQPLTSTADQSPVLSAPTEVVKAFTPTPTNKQQNTPAIPDSIHAKLTSDLLYISDGKLMRWDQMTGFTGMLVDNIVDFSTHHGKRVALLRTRNITANGVELYDLAYLDFETMQVITLLESIPKPPIFALSPDEGRIAYSTNGTELTIHSVELDSSNKDVELGTCQPGESGLCDEITWSQDSLSVLWADSRGVWVSSIKDLTQRKVHPNSVSIQDPVGDEIDVKVTFRDFIWSPQGRYALAEVIPDDSDVRWRCILDTRRLRLVEVPESYKTEGHQTNAIWSQDGSLLVVN